MFDRGQATAGRMIRLLPLQWPISRGSDAGNVSQWTWLRSDVAAERIFHSPTRSSAMPPALPRRGVIVPPPV